MPFYEYECDNCGKIIAVFRKDEEMYDDCECLEKDCTQCEIGVYKLIDAFEAE